MQLLKSIIGLLLFVSGSTQNRRVHCSYAVTSDLKESSEIGRRIIEEGGNALDAAIATAIDIGAVNAFSSGIGGGGFLLLWKVEEEKGSGFLTSFNFRERAPELVCASDYHKKESSSRGPLSVGIPGEINGMYTAHKKYGALPWKRLFQSTVDKLRKGFPVPKVLALKLEEYKSVILTDRGLRETYAVDGSVAKEGEVVRRENLADTLEEISNSPESLYTGRVARKAVEFINGYSRPKPKACVTERDFREYRSEEMAPVVARVPEKDMEVVSIGLPGSGYMVTAGMRILSSVPNVDYRKASEEEFQQILMRLYLVLYGIREKLEDEKNICTVEKRFYGRSNLVADSREEEGRNGVLERAIELAMHRFTRLLEERSYSKGMPGTKILPDHGTSAITVVDKEKMMVSLTTSINFYWGSGMMDPDTGIIFNNQIDDFVFENYTNMNGIRGHSASKNRIAPFKRPMSSIMPTMIRHKENFYVVGASGGTRIPTAIISVMARILLKKKTLSEAVSHPRLHVQEAETVQVESKYPPEFLKHHRGIAQIKTDPPESITSCVHILSFKNTSRGAPMLIEAIADARKCGCSSGGVFPENRAFLEQMKNKYLLSFTFKISAESKAT